MPAILEDLEIDASDMLSNPKDFAPRVVDKSNELREFFTTQFPSQLSLRM